MNLYRLHTSPESLYGHDHIMANSLSVGSELYHITREGDKTMVNDNIIVTDDSMYENGSIPDNTIIRGNLQMSAILETGAEGVILPNNLMVIGDLDLEFTYIRQLPDNLTVYGNLNIVDTAIDNLSNVDNLIVKGSIHIGATGYSREMNIAFQMLEDDIRSNNLNYKTQVYS
jgi:hypothetical protein